ncbi:MAG: protein kinase [Deltaproteobacteria bacterium]|nr:protein kinase [Deltaproteobacteria bacterium]
MGFVPGQRVGDYVIVRKLAEGGMAEVYLATKRGPSGFVKTCVLKRLKAKPEERDRLSVLFDQEAKLGANLQHPNIVQIFDFQRDPVGELYLVMEFVDGCSLEELCQRVPLGIVPPFIAARIAKEIAKALDYATTVPGRDGRPLRLVHRDITPRNILLGRLGEVKIADFGVAKPMAKLTEGMMRGTVGYMAPEQALADRHVDGRTDLFALGLVLYEMVAGCRPYPVLKELDLAERLQRVDEPFEPVRRHNPSVPRELERLIAKMVELRPERRFQSAAELVAALEEFLELAPSKADVDLERLLSGRLPPPFAPEIGTEEMRRPELVPTPAGKRRKSPAPVDSVIPTIVEQVSTVVVPPPALSAPRVQPEEFVAPGRSSEPGREVRSEELAAPGRSSEPGREVRPTAGRMAGDAVRTEQVSAAAIQTVVEPAKVTSARPMPRRKLAAWMIVAALIVAAIGVGYALGTIAAKVERRADTKSTVSSP